MEQCIREISQHYPAIHTDNYVIMPGHVHILLRICSGEDGQPPSAPSISRVVNQLKGTISKRAGFSVWQKDFYDHIIRDEADYQETWNYIQDNPLRWAEKHTLLFDGSIYHG